MFYSPVFFFIRQPSGVLTIFVLKNCIRILLSPGLVSIPLFHPIVENELLPCTLFCCMITGRVRLVQAQSLVYRKLKAIGDKLSAIRFPFEYVYVPFNQAEGDHTGLGSFRWTLAF